MSDVSNQFSFDVLIIGGGAAGLYTALSLPQSVRIALVTKDTLKQSASDWAQGGIAAAMRADDSPDLHAADTFKAGAGLCDPVAVDFLVHNASTQIEHLLEMGVAFDRYQQQLAMTLEAAHSRPRVLHAADATGKALIKTLTNQALLQDNIQVLSECFSLDLLVNKAAHRCEGVLALYQDRIVRMYASAVVLATGGGGQVFSQTTNPLLSTGDGVAMAWRAGVALRDLEFFQFHPTALKVAGAPRFLISEAVRGEGAHLLDHAGQRFMSQYHELGELAPRDIVSQSIVTHLAKSKQKNVYLDLRPIPDDKIQHRFPKIIRVCKSWGIDVFKEPIPVAPAAHYWMGGVQTNLQAQTTLPGLFAVGEVASTGVHGANRLASNSLLECLVFGASLAKSISSELISPRNIVANQIDSHMSLIESDGEALSWDSLSIRQQLSNLMWTSVGISREQEGLSHSLQQINLWRQQSDQTAVQHSLNLYANASREDIPLDLESQKIREWSETHNLLDIAVLIVRSALFREESRGGHSRSDFPKSSEDWIFHSVFQGDVIQKTPLLD